MIDLRRQLDAARGTCVLTNARVPVSVIEAPADCETRWGLCDVDLVLRDGVISDIKPAGSTQAASTIDCAKRIVWPCTVDCHTHLDKGQVWARSPNRDHTFQGALEAASSDRGKWSSLDDVRRRAEFQIASAYAHGTCAIRSHVDADRQTFDGVFETLCDLASEWSGRVDVQLCPFTGIGDSEDWVDHCARTARQSGHGVLSAFIHEHPDQMTFVDWCIRAAEQHGLALDFHADETLDPTSHGTRIIARAVTESGFEGPVLVGHCCSLAQQDDDKCHRTLDLAQQAGLSIVSLPQCNLYLQDRTSDRSPRQRGFAPVESIRRAGVPVALASDNSRDGFHAYGDLDLAETFRMALPLMHLDDDAGSWVDAVTQIPAAIMGTSRGRIGVGASADLIMFSARNWSEFGARPANDRILLRGGRTIDSTPPAFSNLDDLEGNAP